MLQIRFPNSKWSNPRLICLRTLNILLFETLIHQIHQIKIERQSVTQKKILRKKAGEKKILNDAVVHDVFMWNADTLALKQPVNV